MTGWSPLNGVSLVDVSQQLPGPFATLLLRSLGARVIKIEPPAGDPARRIDPPMYARMSAGKEVIHLDLKTQPGRDRLHELVSDADVFVEGFRPGVAARLSADWETLSTLNPRLIYCSLSGFGATGPLAQRPGHDLNFLALAAGLAPGLSDGEALIRVPWVDLAAGTNAALAMVAALIGRGNDGKGHHLEMALLDAAVTWSTAKLPREGAEGAYGVFATADGRRVAAAVMEEAMWERMCHAFGWSDWVEDPSMADHDGRRCRAAEITLRLRDALSRRSAAEIASLALSHDLGINEVNELDAVAADPQIAARDIFPTPGSWRPLGPVGEALSLDQADDSV